MQIPSKKIILLLSLSSIALVGVGIFVYKNKKPEAQPEVNKIAIQVLGDNIGTPEKDTDLDGLKDWEEELWHTNPKVSDTDSDGTPDGKEVEQGRDPLKAGPNDKLQSAEPAPTPKINTERELTETEKFSQEFFAQYLKLKQSGAKLDEQTINDLADQSAQAVGTTLSIKQYSPQEILVTNDSEATALKEYGNAINAIIIKNSPQTRDNEWIILQRSLEQKDPVEADKIKEFANNYKAIVKGLLETKTPNIVASLHLSLINNLSALQTIADSMSKVYTDPIPALKSISEYKNAIQSVANAWTDMKDFFSEKGIIFSKDEPGYAMSEGI